MSTSLVSFNGMGIWHLDVSIAIWRWYANEEIVAMTDPPAWLVEWNARNVVLVSIAGGAIMSPCFEDLLQDPSRLPQFIEIAQRVLKKIESKGPTIALQELKTMGIPDVTDEIPSPLALSLAKIIVFMLGGESAGVRQSDVPPLVFGDFKQYIDWP